MELWLDTIDFELITTAVSQMTITGITTNPSILAKGELTARETINKLLMIQPGKLAVQVTTDDHMAMINQAQMLAAIDPRIIIKVPVNKEGLLAIHTLSQNGIPTMATAIFEARQVLLSALAGANYAAPYLGRISGDSFKVMEDMTKIINIYRFPLKLIIAAIRTTEQVIRCACYGAHAITIPAKVFNEFVNNSAETSASLNNFAREWQESGKSLE